MIVTACVLATLAAAWFLAPKLHRYAYWIDRKTAAEVDALARGRWQVERLQVAEGVELVGLVRSPTAATSKWILFVPGNSTALLQGFQAELDRTLPEDVGIVFFAYRGFEASGGSPNPTNLLADLHRQWQLVCARNGATEPPTLFGYSLGSVLAVQLAGDLAAANHQAQAKPPKPARVVLAAAGERIPIMPHGTFGRFLPSDVYDATTAAPAIDCPVVIVHGTADTALPIATARALRDRIGERAQMVEAEGKGHTDIWAAVKGAAF
ncbi:MAG: lysophospholipase [bacterium]|nr:lysophospholipase [bacterium]